MDWKQSVWLSIFILFVLGEFKNDADGVKLCMTIEMMEIGSGSCKCRFVM